MNKYLITYDLKNATSYNNYIDLHNAIKSISGKWWHYLESTWIIKSDKEKASDINSELLKHIDKNKDFILVIKIDSNNKSGWLPQKAWDWLNS